LPGRIASRGAGTPAFDVFPSQSGLKYLAIFQEIMKMNSSLRLFVLFFMIPGPQTSSQSPVFLSYGLSFSHLSYIYVTA